MLNMYIEKFESGLTNLSYFFLILFFICMVYAVIFRQFIAKLLTKWKKILISHYKGLLLILSKNPDKNKVFFSIYEKLFQRYCNGGFATRIIGVKKVYLIFNPKSAQVILEHSKNVNKADLYKCFVPWLGDSLFLSSGEKWKKRRKLLRPAFHFSVLQNFLTVMDEQSRILVEKLKENKDKDWVDFTPFMVRCALDIICETAMGIQTRVQNEGSSEYVEALDFVREVITERIFERAIIPNFMLYMSAEGRKFKKCIKVMNNFTRKVIEERKIILENKKKENISKEDKYLNIKERKPFLDTVLECYFKDPSFTLEDVKEEVDIFMFAGHDTTAYGLTWICYLLGKNLHVQEKLINEVDDVFRGDTERNITHDDIKKMKYMECVIKESSRIYTPVPMIGRKLSEPVEIDGTKIPKGSNCGVMVYYIHRNAEEFPDPERFDPDRFLPENCSKRHPYSYIPFSAGPRNCIGQKFALLEEKTILTNILRNFTITSIDNDVNPIIGILLHPGKRIRIKFFPRNVNG